MMAKRLFGHRALIVTHASRDLEAKNILLKIRAESRRQK
jgi:hypothetical protein